MRKQTHWGVTTCSRSHKQQELQPGPTPTWIWFERQILFYYCLLVFETFLNIKKSHMTLKHLDVYEVKFFIICSNLPLTPILKHWPTWRLRCASSQIFFNAYIKYLTHRYNAIFSRNRNTQYIINLQLHVLFSYTVFIFFLC